MNDTIEVPDRIDVSEYKTAAGAAKATAEALREWAEFYGFESGAIEVHPPDEARDLRGLRGDHDAWLVAWEGGPSSWATSLTGGESLTWRSAGGGHVDPEVDGLLDADGFHVECHYSFDLLFTNT